MNFKKLILIISIFFLSACNQFDQENKNLVYITDQKYSNTGFTLIYDDELKKEKKISKKIDNRSLLIFHNKIKKNSFVKITNPVNDKSIIAEVISNNVNFSSFYNSVITKRIAEELSLDPKEPYIDLVLISKSSTFVAKKAKTFDEEKSVAEKAPVDGITIDNLGKEKNKEVKIIGSGVTANWTDTSNGSDGDPYDLTISVNAAQTGITSIFASGLEIGEDDETKIYFESSNTINFYANNWNRSRYNRCNMFSRGWKN